MTQTRNSGDSGYTWTDWQNQPDEFTAHGLAASESRTDPSHHWHVRTLSRQGYRIDEYRYGQWVRAWHEDPKTPQVLNS